MCNQKTSQKSSHWAITPQKQPKTFVVQNVKEVQLSQKAESSRNFTWVASTSMIRPRSVWPNTMASEAVLQAIEANPVSSPQRLSGEIGIS